MQELKIFDIKWSSCNAGPSPDNNRRVELFLSGCSKAIEGNPCQDCFNERLWDSESYGAKVTPKEAFDNIKKFAPNKYITFVGGEPLDQMEPLVELLKLLKKDGFHTLIITHHDVKILILKSKEAIINDKSKEIKMLRELLDYTDVFIDGEYDKNQRIFNEKATDGLHNVIGSGNQKIWDLRSCREDSICHIDRRVKFAKDVDYLELNKNDHIVFGVNRGAV